ncbi:MAG: DUF1150 family protein [Proteobacteria bacterium]|nr:DUF1150 family protein [Pseudomonadota bacterium]MDE2239455.1 DUF1150 family protein [Rhodospirillales bacterium]
MNIKNHDGTANFSPGTMLDIHHISAAQLALLGLEEIAFVKPVMTETGPAFAIHAADGTPIAIAADQQLAAAAIIQNDMTPTLVH